MIEYERAISTLTVKSQNLETELSEAHSRELNYINGSKMASSPPPEADPVTVLTKTIEELKAQLLESAFSRDEFALIMFASAANGILPLWAGLLPGRSTGASYLPSSCWGAREGAGSAVK